MTFPPCWTVRPCFANHHQNHFPWQFGIQTCQQLPVNWHAVSDFHDLSEGVERFTMFLSTKTYAPKQFFVSVTSVGNDRNPKTCPGLSHDDSYLFFRGES
jgi:hypothetical protein